MDHGRNPGKGGAAWARGRENEWIDCVANDLRLFGIGDGEEWRTSAYEPGQ